MPTLHNITNQKFGKLIAIKQVGSVNNHTAWLCKCDCGKEKIIKSNSLITGHTKSCGCLSYESKLEKSKLMQKVNTKAES